jgi:hypothetical protein
MNTFTPYMLWRIWLAMSGIHWETELP